MLAQVACLVLGVLKPEQECQLDVVIEGRSRLKELLRGANNAIDGPVRQPLSGLLLLLCGCSVRI